MKLKFKELSNEQKSEIINNFKKTDEWKTQVIKNITKKLKKKKKIECLRYKDYIINVRCRFDKDNNLHLMSTFHLLTVEDVKSFLSMIYKKIPKYLNDIQLHRICVFSNHIDIGEHRVYVFSLNGMEMKEDFIQLRKDIEFWIKEENSNCIKDINVNTFMNDEKEMSKYLDKTYKFNENGEIYD